MPTITIVGTTAWGTTMAGLLASTTAVRLLARTGAEATALTLERRNHRMVEGKWLPPSVTITEDPEEAFYGTDLALLAVPSQTMRPNVRSIADLLRACPVIVSGAKGIEVETGLRMTEVMAEELGEACQSRIVALSGPNLATEIARGLPATTVVASEDLRVAEAARNLLMTRTFRVYSQTDVVGVEMGGALKNIIAIGAGVSDGKGFGDNAKAAFVTRGLAEITRLGVAAGANPLTFAGIAGLGDLWATCNSKFSRNRRLGEALARGVSLKQATIDLGHVAEGIPTTRGAKTLSDRLDVEMPIVNQAYRVLFGNLDVDSAVVELMVRDAKHEFEGLVPHDT